MSSSRQNSSASGILSISVPPTIGSAVSGGTANSGLIVDGSGNLGQELLSTIKYTCLGRLVGANMNSTADQAITINASQYVIKEILVMNASTNLTTAVGGFYGAAGKATAIVANTQVYTALSGASKYVDLTLGTLLGTDIRTESTLYLSLTIAQGGAATADIYILGIKIS